VSAQDAFTKSFIDGLDPQDKGIQDLAKFHPDLPGLLLSVVASSYSENIFDALEEKVTTEGMVRGRSKQKVVVEEEEDVVAEERTYTRPNGDIYYPRKWTGIEDVITLRKAREVQQSPLFYGPPGTGKTALCEAAFNDLVTVVFSGDTEVADLVGSFIPRTDGEAGYEWIDGPLLVAMKEGRPFLADEIGLGDPKVLSVLYSLMDGRGELNVTANPEVGTVKAEEGFFIIGATNPNAPGVRMSEALLSRFALHVEVTTDWELAVKLGVPNKIVRLAENLQQQVKQNKLEWAPQFRELLAFRDVQANFGYDFALANLLASCPEDDRKAVAAAITNIVGVVKPATI
jgi:nitric oxide reductase NorQ protein